MVAFFFSETHLEVRRDIYIYEMENFVAEVGGFLGLLLGASIFTVFDMTMEYVKKKKLLQSEKSRKVSARERIKTQI